MFPSTNAVCGRKMGTLRELKWQRKREGERKRVREREKENNQERKKFPCSEP